MNGFMPCGVGLQREERLLTGCGAFGARLSVAAMVGVKVVSPWNSRRVEQTG